MNKTIRLSLLLVVAQLAHVAPAVAAEPSPRQVLDRVLEADPWGLSGAIISAQIVVRDHGGATRELAFTGRSRRYDGTLS